MGVNFQKVARTLICFSDNSGEAITENWSSRLDKLESIQKRKRQENTYKRCAQLMRNGFNITYAVLLLRAQKCQPPGGGVTSSEQRWERSLLFL